MTRVDVGVLQAALRNTDTVVTLGRVTRVAGLLVEASLQQVPIGMGCNILLGNGRSVAADVVGFHERGAILMPQELVHGVYSGCQVSPRVDGDSIAVGPALLGRVVDANLQPMDGGPPVQVGTRVPLQGVIPAAMARRRIEKPFALGVRCIDALLTLGEGQRMGIMAGPGVGKSVLLGMVARQCEADVIVVGLVGERGREVREFVERDLGNALPRAVVVVATADEAPLLRIRAALCAAATAEHFRSQGKKVLLLLDSLTRVAMAQREIGLAVGEPPTSKGYTPSVFALLARLVERAGNDAGPGSITALYTVLAEGDDLADPVVDAARAALDGHLVLSRALAGAGHFPAVDVLQSVSRVMGDVTTPAHRELARQARDALAAHQEAAPLIEVGAYVKGSNPRVDRALQHIQAIQAFCRQGAVEMASLTDTLAALRHALSSPGEARHA